MKQARRKELLFLAAFLLSPFLFLSHVASSKEK